MSENVESPRTYVQDTHLASRYGVSRATIWRWVSEGRLPKPIKLTPGCSRWNLQDPALVAFERGAA